MALSVPADHQRGPHYLAPALAAIHEAFRGRTPWCLLLARYQAQVGLLYRATDTLAPVVLGQLLAAYPDLRVESVDEAAFGSDRDCFWARLRLTPQLAPLVAAEKFIDREEGRLADPLAALLGVIASGRGEAVRPLVSLAVRPVGRVRVWWLRRRVRHRPAATKLAGPLWAVDVRIAVQAPGERKSAALAKLHELSGVFAQYLPPGAGRWRLSRVRAGRLPSRLPLRGIAYLSSAELGLLWHPPTASVRTPRMRINESRALEPPAPGVLPTLAGQPHLAVLGRTAFRDRREVFGLLPEDRLRGLYVLGASGCGKTTLLMNLIAADIRAGRSTAVVDPHGDMVQQLLDAVPAERTNNVILFDPADPQHGVAYNPLTCRHPRERPLVAAAIVTSFKRLFAESWGPRLQHILNCCLLTLLETPDATLLSLHRLLVDEAFRKQLVGRIEDEFVRAFWTGEWARWTPQFRAEAISPVLNKVAALTANYVVRAAIGDPHAKLNLRQALDSGMTLLCRISKGQLGEEPAQLLGGLITAGLQLAAMSRAELPPDERRPAFVYIDEVHNFAGGPTLATAFSEGRKFGTGWTVAHQHIGQLDNATAQAIFGNAGTIAAFRLGPDAEVLAEQLGGDLTPADLRNLPKHQAYIRLLIDGLPSAPFSMTTLPPPPRRYRAAVVRRVSRERFGRRASSVGAPPARRPVDTDRQVG